MGEPGWPLDFAKWPRDAADWWIAEGIDEIGGVMPEDAVLYILDNHLPK